MKSRFPEQFVKGFCGGCGVAIPSKNRWCADCRENNIVYNGNGWRAKKNITERAKNKCEQCGYQFMTSYFNGDHEYHHVIPFSEGGSHHISNIKLLCHDCHKKETAKWRYERSQKKKNEDDATKQAEERRILLSKQTKLFEVL